MCSILAYCSAKADPKAAEEMLSRTISRGPDDSRILNTGNGFLGFNRLSIMGLHPEGMQPFMFGGNAVVCNGELYGFRRTKEELIAKGYKFISDSDCEIILPLYEEMGVGMFEALDAEFAMVIYGCILAGMGRGRSFWPPSLRTWWGSAGRSCRSRPGSTR